MKRLLRSLLPESVRKRLVQGRERLMLWSLRAAIRGQGLVGLADRLQEILPDIRRQYTAFEIDTPYLETKVRGQHAFQMSLAAPEIASRKGLVVADIGDSSGTHIAYLKTLHPDSGARFLSVNLDPEAVAKIRAKGLEAVLARAEELDRHGITADVFLSFETMEHLSDPIEFLHALAAKKPRRLILTVPYVRQSRVGLHHIRQGGAGLPVTPETTHLFEFCPEDLRLLFAHAGWKVEREAVYRQYPAFSWLALTRPLWRALDFEGFYGAVLSPDDRWSSLYRGWR